MRAAHLCCLLAAAAVLTAAKDASPAAPAPALAAAAAPAGAAAAKPVAAPAPKLSEREREREEKEERERERNAARNGKQPAAAAGKHDGGKEEEDDDKDREEAYEVKPVSPAAAAAAADAALKRAGASKAGLPAAQLPAAAAALAPRVVRHKPLSPAEEARVKAAFNISGGAVSRSQLAALAANRTGLMFALADVDGDGEVTKEEYVAYAARDVGGAGNNTKIPASVDRLFDRVAGPGASTMNASAADRAGVADAVTAYFLAADTDGDGRVTIPEMNQPLPGSVPRPDGDHAMTWVPLAAPMDAATVLRVYGWDGDGRLDRKEADALFDDTSAAALANNARPGFKLVAASLDDNGDGKVAEEEVVPATAAGAAAQGARAAFKKAAGGGANATLSYDRAAAELDDAHYRAAEARAKGAGVKRGDTLDAAALAKVGNTTKAAAAADVARYDVAGRGALDRVSYALWAADKKAPGSAAARGNGTKGGEPEPAR